MLTFFYCWPLWILHRFSGVLILSVRTAWNCQTSCRRVGRNTYTTFNILTDVFRMGCNYFWGDGSVVESFQYCLMDLTILKLFLLSFHFLCFLPPLFSLILFLHLVFFCRPPHHDVWNVICIFRNRLGFVNMFWEDTVRRTLLKVPAIRGIRLLTKTRGSVGVQINFIIPGSTGERGLPGPWLSPDAAKIILQEYYCDKLEQLRVACRRPSAKPLDLRSLGPPASPRQVGVNRPVSTASSARAYINPRMTIDY